MKFLEFYKIILYFLINSENENFSHSVDKHKNINTRGPYPQCGIAFVTNVWNGCPSSQRDVIKIANTKKLYNSNGILVFYTYIVVLTLTLCLNLL